MSQSFMPSDGNGTPDFLSVINAEVNKVEPRILALPAPSTEQQSPQSPVAQSARQHYFLHKNVRPANIHYPYNRNLYNS